MKAIAKIIDMIQDELDGAKEYALTALEWKKDYPKISQRLNELAGVEMQHSKILHGEVEKLIEEYRNQNGEPPESMLAVYDYEHKKMIKQAAQIKSMIDEYDQ